MPGEKLTVLHCTAGTSDKLYVFFFNGGEVHTYNGRNGGKLINQGSIAARFLPAGYYEAMRAKLKKGYVELDLTKPLESSVVRSLLTIITREDLNRLTAAASTTAARSDLGPLSLKNLSSLLSD